MIYGYEYNFDMPSGMAANQNLMMGLSGVITALILVFALLAVALSVAGYVLGAVGTYRIAKRRGIHHAWLAWIPVGKNWLLGSISDHYQYVVKHNNSKRRRVLLVLSAILLGLSVLFGGTVAVSNLVVGSFGAMEAGNHFALGIVLMLLYYWVVFALNVAVAVVGYIAYYDLFRSCKPGYAVLFLVLSIVFRVALPIFVFACSSSDQGMPERRTPAPKMQHTDEPEIMEEEIPVVEAELVDDDCFE